MPTPDPNNLLRAARERTPSRRTPGIAMSREELADAVALWCAQHDPQHRTVAFDATHLSKIERGVVRRPRPHYLAALCAILGATETDLGFGPQSPFLISPASGWDRGSVATGVERTMGEDLATTRRQAILAVALVGTTLTVPLQRWLDPLPDIPAPAGGNAYTSPDVEALEAMVTHMACPPPGAAAGSTRPPCGSSQNTHSAPGLNNGIEPPRSSRTARPSYSSR